MDDDSFSMFAINILLHIKLLNQFYRDV